jgi:hypothetical protein
MPLILKFIISLVITFTVVAGTSLVWPKLTSYPRPEPLTQVRNMVLTTDIGKSVAQTLGVQDEATVVPVDIGTVAGSAISSAAAGVQQKASDAVTREIILQVVNKIETLAPDQQQIIKEQICK